jgi:general secretion pathway protein D
MSVQSMNSPTLFRMLLRLTFVLALFFLTANLQAQQSARPGGAVRSNAGQRATTRASTTTSTGAQTGPRQYRSNTVLGDAIIQIDPESRSLVVITDEETHTEIDKVIKNLDQPKPQVLIKVVFLEVTYNKDIDVGLEGSYTFNVGNPLLSGSAGTVQTVRTDTTTTTNGSSQVVTTTNGILQNAASAGTATVQSLFGLSQLTDGSFVRVVTDDWSATLRALSQRGKLEVLSRPSILARNNQEAVIVVGQEVPFVTNSRVTDAGQTINTISYENVGIILRVTPFITSEGMVEMIVAPEISTLTDQTVPISNTVSAPVIAKRSAETVVMTPNASTVVIGGLMETQRTETIRKIPLLGDIPLLGLPFRRTIKADVKRELLIFLTPYIVNSPEGLKKLTLSEANKTELAPKAFTPEEISNALDTLKLVPEDEPEIRRATEVRATEVHTIRLQPPAAK